MFVLLTAKNDGFGQLILVLLIFVFVLGITAFTTRWIADYQKKQGQCGNIELLESASIGNNKFVQIVRVADKHFAIAVGKDSVTFLGEIAGDRLKSPEEMPKMDFKQLLDKAIKKDHTSTDTKE